MDDRPAKARRSSLPPVLADTRSRASNSSARPPPHPRRYFSSHLAPRVTAPPPPSIRVRSRTKNRPPAPRGSFSPGRRSINVIQFGQLGRPSCTILGGAVAGVLGSSSPRERRERERERERERKRGKEKRVGRLLRQIGTRHRDKPDVFSSDLGLAAPSADPDPIYRDAMTPGISWGHL